MTDKRALVGVFFFVSCFCYAVNSCKLIDEEDFINELEEIRKEVVKEEKGEPLGLHDGWIPDTAISASSQRDGYHGAQLGRLNSAGGWAAKHDDGNQWIQVDLGAPTTLTEVLTQGRQDADQWVKQFTIGFSDDGVKFRVYKSRGFGVIFRGNKDRNTVVKNTINPPIQARFIQIYPCSWHNHIAMRIELKGKVQNHLRHCPVSMDLGFVIDGSNEVKGWDFKREKQFVKQVISTFTISRHQNRVGFVTYSDKADVVMDFSGLDNFSEVDKIIKNAIHRRGSHQRLDIGLRAAYKALVKSQAQGYVPQRSIVAITNRKAVQRRVWYIINAKKALEQKGIKLFLVVIGQRDEVLKRKLGLKSSDFMFFLPTFRSLSTHVARIAHVICQHQHKETDIIRNN
ncbi:neuropilin-1a [Exaiptasia diaphana]|uniref:Uncharacterized protein n=1 Tax=Exaiptasia diaphana TaxID=2652724 RepID=A0A913XYV5_EXADI|nr:neuropilin-1a [Exaiptasia diaphana]KXJ24041.1 Lactadherin [Exaiptasia diaphana]